MEKPENIFLVFLHEQIDERKVSLAQVQMCFQLRSEPPVFGFIAQKIAPVFIQVQ